LEKGLAIHEFYLGQAIDAATLGRITFPFLKGWVARGLNLTARIISQTRPDRLEHVTMSTLNLCLLEFFNSAVNNAKWAGSAKFARDAPNLKDYRPTSLTLFAARDKKDCAAMSRLQVQCMETSLLFRMLATKFPAGVAVFSSITHLEFEDNAMFLDTTLPLRVFPNLTHIAWTVTEADEDNLVGAAAIMTRFGAGELPEQISLAVIHIVRNLELTNPETILDEILFHEEWRKLLDALSWPKERKARLIDGAQYSLPQDGQDTWTRGKQFERVYSERLLDAVDQGVVKVVERAETPTGPVLTLKAGE
jgi:hypothetical protein